MTNKMHSEREITTEAGKSTPYPVGLGYFKHQC